jgi:hypothetical protein
MLSTDTYFRCAVSMLEVTQVSCSKLKKHVQESAEFSDDKVSDTDGNEFNSLLIAQETPGAVDHSDF